MERVGRFSTARPLPTPCGKGRPVHFMGSLRFAVSASPGADARRDTRRSERGADITALTPR